MRPSVRITTAAVLVLLGLTSCNGIMDLTPKDQLSDEAAVGLARLSVGAGDVVALAMASLPEYVVAYLAVAKLGAVTAGVNDRLSERERSAVLSVAHSDVRPVAYEMTLLVKRVGVHLGTAPRTDLPAGG